MSQEFVERGSILNINVGILGHVDSGKTSLVKSLSTSLSTAALDKNPQSQQRGITLDLGFSSFTLPMPDHLVSSTYHEYDSIQFTLVDCPGHASLIRTIIGGAQIIDMILLVVDANKGIQTQTAECIVIGEITTDNMIVVMNKIDMLPENEREVRIERMTKRIRKIFSSTKFANVPIIPIAAAIGGEKVAAVSVTNGTNVNAASSGSVSKKNVTQSQGIDTLVDLIKNTVQIPVRNVNAPFYYSIDHCFPIKGHGTVLTGTVLSGSISLNQTIEIPHMQIQRKVKSLQMFRKPVRTAKQGDRVGICVTNLDPNSIERSIAAYPGSVPLLSSVICMVKKVRFFKGACKSNTKFHISIGHTTIISTAVFFGAAELTSIMASTDNDHNDKLSEGSSIVTSNKSNSKHIGEKANVNKQSTLNATYQNNFPLLDFNYSSDYLFQSEMVGSEEGNVNYGVEPIQWALLQFQQPVFCPIGSLVIGSRLDADTRETSNGGLGNSGAASQCRLAFYGPVRESLTEDEYDRIRVFNWKSKECEVFRITDVRGGFCHEVIGWKLVSETGSVTPFLGMKVETENGVLGTIVGAFGSGGKFRVKFPHGAKVTAGGKLVLRFKRYLYDKTRRMGQSGMTGNIDLNTTADHDLDTDGAVNDDLSKMTLQETTVQGVPYDPREGDPVGRHKNKRKEGTKPQVIATVKANETTKVSRDVMTPTHVTTVQVNQDCESPSKRTYVSTSSPNGSNTITLNSPHANNIVGELTVSPSVVVVGPEKSISTTSAAAALTNITSNAITMNSGNIRCGKIESLKGDVIIDGVNCGFEMAIVSGAFRMEENIRLVADNPTLTRVIGPNGEIGELLGPFGKLGKCKIRFNGGCKGPVDGGMITIHIL